MACGARLGLKLSTKVDRPRLELRLNHYSGTSFKAWRAELTSEAQPLRRKEESLESGQAPLNSDGHLLQASQGERGRQAEVEGTGAAMQRAVDVPGLDAASLAELACGREAALLTLKAESRQGGEPGKPRRRIGQHRQHTLVGCNGHHAAVGAHLDEWQRARTPVGVRCFSRDCTCSLARDPGRRRNASRGASGSSS